MTTDDLATSLGTQLTNLKTDLDAKLAAQKTELEAIIRTTGAGAGSRTAAEPPRERKSFRRIVKEDYGGVEFSIAVVVGIILIGIPLGCWIGTTPIGIFFQPWRWF